MSEDINSGAVDSERRRVLQGTASLGILGVVGTVGAGAEPVSDRLPDGTPTAESLWFAGLQQTAVDGASLHVESGSMVVSNVEDGGGFHVDVGETNGFMSRMPVDPSRLPAGATMIRRMRGIVDGEPDQPIWRLGLRHTEEQGTFEAMPGYRAIGSETYTLRLVDGEEVVYEGGGHAEPTLMQQDGEKGLECCGFPPFYQYWETYEPNSYVTPAGDEFEATRVEFEPDERSVESAVLTDVVTRASGLSSFVIDDELVGAHGLPHRALGDARLAPRDGGSVLTVSNLGETGADGVAAQLDAVEGFRMDLDPVDLREGAALTMSARGNFGGEPDSPLGSVEVANDGDGLTVTADYEPIGASEVRLDVFNGDEQVTTVYGEPGEVARAVEPVAITDCGKLPPWPLPCFIGQFDDVVEFELVDESRAAGDDLRVLASDADAELQHLSQFSLRGQAVGELHVVGEETGEIA